MTGGWSGVTGAAPVLNGPADADDGADRVLGQPAKCLGNQGDEICPRGAAGREVGGKFPLHTNLEGMAWCLGCLSDGELLERADDQHIKSSGASETPAGDENVARASLRARHQAGGLLGGSQSSGLGSSVDNITDCVVPGDAIPVPPAAYLVITVGISSEAAFRAGV